jgi:hypothetical protein
MYLDASGQNHANRPQLGVNDAMGGQNEPRDGFALPSISYNVHYTK